MSFDAPQSRNEAILQNILGAENVLVPAQSEIEAILLAILNDTSYSLEGRSRIARLLIAIKNNGTWDELPCISRNEEILYCILNGEAYQGETYSRNEELLKQWSESHATYEKTVTGNPIHVTDAVEETALALSVAFEPKQAGTPFVGDTTYEPYLSKTASTTGNKRYLDKIVGGTVAWNQLNTQSIDFFSEQISYCEVSLTSSGLSYDFKKIGGTNYSSGASHELVKNHLYCITGQFRKYAESEGNIFIDIRKNNSTYNTSNAKKYVVVNSTEPTEFALCEKTDDEYYMLGFRFATAVPLNSTALVTGLQITDITKLFSNAPAIADYIYSLEQATTGAGMQWLKSYGFIDGTYRAHNPGQLISCRPEGIQYGSTTHAFGSPVELRGLYKLDANNKLYCDGDELTPDGTLKTNYDYRAYQSGDEELTDAITDGTNTVVKKVTPTTTSSETYPNPVDIANGDTESFTDSRAVPIPCGNESHYAGEYEIEGHESVTVYQAQTQDEPNPTEYEVEFTEQGTVYGGVIDIVTGTLSITWGYIASYNGETLTGRWISSLDAYSEGGTPTTGAEVAYELASPITAELTPQQVDMLLGENTVWTDDASESISLTYIGTNPAVQLLAGLRKNSNNAKMVKLLKGGLKDAEIIRK